MILAKVVGILCCVQPSQMSSTTMSPSAQTTQTTLSHCWTARTTCWYRQPTRIIRRSQLCCRMGQCQLPSCSTGPKLVCCPPTMSSLVPSTLHSISQCPGSNTAGSSFLAILPRNILHFFFCSSVIFFVPTNSNPTPTPQVYDYCIWQSIFVLLLQL